MPIVRVDTETDNAEVDAPIKNWIARYLPTLEEFSDREEALSALLFAAVHFTAQEDATSTIFREYFEPVKEGLLGMEEGEEMRDGRWDVTRVPGGWIYFRTVESGTGGFNVAAVFVPEPPKPEPPPMMILENL